MTLDSGTKILNSSIYLLLVQRNSIHREHYFPISTDQSNCLLVHIYRCTLSQQVTEFGLHDLKTSILV